MLDMRLRTAPSLAMALLLAGCGRGAPTLPTLTIAVNPTGVVSKIENQQNVFHVSDLIYEEGKGDLVLLDLTATRECWIEVQGLSGVSVLSSGSPLATTVVDGRSRIELKSGSYRLKIKGTRP